VDELITAVICSSMLGSAWIGEQRSTMPEPGPLPLSPSTVKGERFLHSSAPSTSPPLIHLIPHLRRREGGESADPDVFIV
jgi:hypothetical protein